MVGPTGAFYSFRSQAASNLFASARAAGLPENAARILKIFKRTCGSAHEARETNPKEKHMLWTIFVILLILWLLGGFIVPFGGNLIHILLVIAVVVLIFNLISGRKSL